MNQTASKMFFADHSVAWKTEIANFKFLRCETDQSAVYKVGSRKYFTTQSASAGTKSWKNGD